MPSCARGVRETSTLSLSVSSGGSDLFRKRRSHVKGPMDIFYEVSLFTKNDVIGVHHRRIRDSFGVGFEAYLVSLVRGKTLEANEREGYIVRAFVGKKEPDEVRSAAGNA